MIRARVLGLVLTLAALGGCQPTPPTPPAAHTAPVSTSLPPLTPQTPTIRSAQPDAGTPHATVRIRPMVQADASGPPTAITDPAQAAKIRQSPGIMDEPGPQQAALASLDCTKPDPLAGRDVAGLPLAACNGYSVPCLLGPTVLDGTQIASAGYEFSIYHDWNVALSFTPAAKQAWADYPGSHGGKFALVVDGKVLGTVQMTDSLDGDLLVIDTGFDEQRTHDLAAVINNH